MDKVSKKILNFMIAGEKGTSYVCAMSELSATRDTTIVEMSKSIREPVNDIRFAIKYLVDNGYLCYCGLSKYANASICLSHKGLHRRRVSWDAFCKFAAQSILTPIVVTILTEVLLHGIPALLKLIQ